MVPLAPVGDTAPRGFSKTTQTRFCLGWNSFRPTGLSPERDLDSYGISSEVY